MRKIELVSRVSKKEETPDNFSGKLALLQKTYTRDLPAKIREIEDLWSKLLERNNAGELQKFHRAIHGLAGSGAIFGFPSLSVSSRFLENILRPLMDLKEFPGNTQKKEISRIVRLLNEASKRPEHELPIPEIEQSNNQERRSDKLVYLLDEEETEGSDLARQMDFFGYPVKVLSNVAELRTALVERLPSALLVSVPQKGSPMRLIDFAASLTGAGSVPKIFLVDNEDLSLHLHTLRAGGQGFFVKPFDLGDLVDKIDVLTGQNRHAPYRVLIVEDDTLLSSYYQLTLERAGIQCQVVESALGVLSPIRSFQPDLMLLDVVLDDCSGLELAAMLRQRDSLLGISIVFLSADAGLETQSVGIALGAEDYLTKPMRADQLVSVLLPRLERSRILREIMDKDGLTGLLNHTKTKEQLESHLQIAQQEPISPLTFVMIDIDHFKHVNDTFGHPTGDRILKSLARLLKQRLRKDDIVGRYGGEEFAVILPNTGLDEAREVLDDIRESFASVSHKTSGQEFKVTFSCGLASWPACPDGQALSDAADSALYEAKRAGRNRVVVSS